MDINAFDKFIGSGSYVRCRGKVRVDQAILTLSEAKKWLYEGGQIGWWVTQPFIIVDIDEGQKEAMKAIKDLNLRTFACKTPRGLHLYFKTGKSFQQSIKMVLPIGLKCDFRCAGKGYVLLPFGNKDDRKFNKIRTVVDLPKLWTPLAGRTQSLTGLKEGEGRNTTLFNHLMAYKNRGGDIEDIEKLANTINRCIFKERMSSREINYVVKHVDKYEANNTGGNPYIIYTDKGKPSKINQRAIVDYFVNIGNLFSQGGDIYLYKDGVYSECNSFIRNSIKEMIQADNLITYRSIMDTFKLIADDDRIKRCSEEINKDRNVIIFNNGVWDIEKRQLFPHTTKYLHTVKIPYEKKKYKAFNKTMFYQFLRKLEIPKEDMKMILEYMAYCLTLDYGLKTFMCLVGPSNTGKSVLIRFIENMVGKSNVSSLSMQDISQRFYPTQMFGRLLNTCADNSSLPLKSIENLKKVTGGDRIMHEKKGGEPFFFVSFAKLLFSFNQLPLQLEEKSNAFYKRMRILQMNSELKLNNAYVDGLCSKESIEEVIPYLLTLLPLSEIRTTDLSNTSVDSLRKDSDSVYCFISNEIKHQPNTRLAKRDFFERYNQYCLLSDRKAHGKHNVLRYLRMMNIKEGRNSEGEACFIGIGFRRKI